MFKVFKTHPAGQGLGALLGTLVQALHVRAPAPPQGDLAPTLDSALAQLECGDWRGAFTQMAALADAGDAQAARIALLMVNRGSLLFGGVFTAPAHQSLRWLEIADQSTGAGVSRTGPRADAEAN